MLKIAILVLCCIVSVVLGSDYPTSYPTVDSCDFGVATIQKVYDHAKIFQKKYDFGLVQTTTPSPLQEQYTSRCYPTTGCYFQFRVLNETGYDELQGTYEIEDGKVKITATDYQRGRDWTATEDLYRYGFKKMDTGFVFENSADFRDTSKVKTFEILSNDLNPDFISPSDLPDGYKSFIRDLVDYKKKTEAFLNSVAVEDRDTMYYHFVHKTDTSKSTIQFSDTDSPTNTILITSHDGISTSGDYICLIWRQDFTIENDVIVLTGQPAQSGAF